MRSLLLCLLVLLVLAPQALADEAPPPVMTILFSANSFGEYKPCPS